MNAQIVELVEASKVILSMAYGCEMEKRRRSEGRTPAVDNQLIRIGLATALQRLQIAVNAVEMAEKL